MKIKKSMVSIGKNVYTVIKFNYTPRKENNIQAEQRHFIEILQKQGLMTEQIDKFIEKVKKAKNLTEARKIVYEYLLEFGNDFKALEDISNETIDINCDGKSIIYLNRKNSILESDNLNTNLSKSTNRFYIINPKDEEFKFKINGRLYESSGVKIELSSIEKLDLLYYMAYKEYWIGNSDKSLDILSISLKDKYLTQLVLNAFTFKERENCKEMLLKAAHNKKIKLEAGVWTSARFIEGVKKEEELLENGPCLMDLFEIFEKNGDEFIPVSSKKYRRIGKKVIDTYNVFKSDNSVRLETSFSNLVFSKEKLNISIRYEIPGIVTINPRQAKAAGFNTNVFNAKIYREQTIIRDGDINIEKFQALVSGATLEYLKKLKIKGLVILLKKKVFEEDTQNLIQLNILRIPVLSRNYILRSDNLDYILDTYYEQRVAECKQKAIKYFIKMQGIDTKLSERKYTKKQIELLKAYGLDYKGVYSGVYNQAVKEVRDEYEYRSFEFGIKHFGILPKVENLLKKIENDKSKLNMPETLMKEYVEYLRGNQIESSLEKLNILLQEQKNIIKKNTRILAKIKLAKSISCSFWKGLKVDARGNYLYEREDKTLLIKLDRKVV